MTSTIATIAASSTTCRCSGSARSPYPRRGALKLLGGASMGLLLGACGSDSKAGSTSTTASASTTTGGALVTEAIPEETGGPYPALTVAV